MTEKSSHKGLTFTTKGETLLSLKKSDISARILDGKLLTYSQFNSISNEQLQNIFIQLSSNTLIVRSSCSSEDTAHQSNAGKFESVGNISNIDDLKHAISSVFKSYQENLAPTEHVLIQPQLTKITHCGVAFSCIPDTGAPYIVISESSDGKTNTVTSGETDQFTTYYAINNKFDNQRHSSLGKLIKELKHMYLTAEIDIEYAFCEHDQLPILLQVRPLIHKTPPQGVELISALKNIEARLDVFFKPHPYLDGKTTVFGVMPDWNPAEIIGIRPKPLALSLYKDLITDSTWAYQRNNYGYKNLRSFPLMIDLKGLPYIDVRTSFNSFIPNDLPPLIAEKLVDFYLNKLIANPCSHDKVEFDIVLSCYSLDIKQRLKTLRKAGFSETECQLISASLRNLTNKIIDPRSGLWIQDLHKIEKLKQRQKTVKKEIENPLQRIYWLLEDCKRYGTLPFAGLARAGFIAVQLLQSLVNESIISAAQYQEYLLSLNTVSGLLNKDFKTLNREEFLKKYGHLRPGTYDITSARYDSTPDKYFDWQDAKDELPTTHSFKLSKEQYQKLHLVLEKHNINHSVDSFLHFIASAIEGREFAKFVFTKSLSDAIEDIASVGQSLGFTREDMAFADINVIRNFAGNADDPATALRLSISQGKEKQILANLINLPALICNTNDIYRFSLLPTEPNFITQQSVIGDISTADSNIELRGKIICIPQADPGYDWLFAKGIAGLITEFGGCNSHMAIRASELGLPAIIGAGTKLYSCWSQATRLQIDCANKKVTHLS
ncbi:PEP-utilizing enzyme [Shewanella waksmanii]|uniref:PEP-utilizing enzyme n=1 Tax=Shewanella waksmanii TaxID=213783 RepID=UPI00373616C4